MKNTIGPILAVGITGAVAGAAVWLWGTSILQTPISSPVVPSGGQGDGTVQVIDQRAHAGATSVPGTSPGHLASPGWQQRFDQADDMAAFIHDALTALETGDANAGWYLHEAVVKCLGAVVAMRQGEHATAAYLAVNGSELERNRREQNVAHCRGMVDDPFFDDWSNERGSPLDPAVWRERALALGSPHAQAFFSRAQSSG